MIHPQASRASDLLRQQGIRVVFAESCTAGMVASLLAAVPGISAYLCGSMVTYRISCKEEWLGIDPQLITEHTAESEPVTTQMAVNVLKRTPQATVSAAIAGHLGPDAPNELDGAVFVAVARRRASEIEIMETLRHQLASATRVERQQEAALLVLTRLAEVLDR